MSLSMPTKKNADVSDTAAKVTTDALQGLHVEICELTSFDSLNHFCKTHGALAIQSCQKFLQFIHGVRVFS